MLDNYGGEIELNEGENFNLNSENFGYSTYNERIHLDIQDLVS